VDGQLETLDMVVLIRSSCGTPKIGSFSMSKIVAGL
jgi:hypothetical protein